MSTLAGRWAAEYILVNSEKLTDLATRFVADPLEVPDWRMPIYPAADDATFVQFIGVQNALNFCFTDPISGGKYMVNYQDVPWAGATGLCAALLRARDDGFDVLDADFLAKLDLATAANIFRSDEAPITLLPERVALLNSLAASLQKYDGKFINLFTSCGYDAAEIISTLVAEFPAYANDRFLHPRTKELLVFDKRARLLPLIYEGRARASEGVLPTLDHVEAIGPVVDYQLPKALRAMGVLCYSDELACAIDNGELLAPGSEPELAIRAVTHDVVEQLLLEVNAMADEPMSMVEIDFALWFTGRKAEGKHHLTLTTAY